MTIATAAQGALADSALQKTDIATGSANGTISVDGDDRSRPRVLALLLTQNLALMQLRLKVQKLTKHFYLPGELSKLNKIGEEWV